MGVIFERGTKTKSTIIAPSNRTRALCSMEWTVLWGLKLAPNPLPLPSPIGESEDFDVFWDLENFTIASIRTPPPPIIGESEELDWGKWRVGCVERFRQICHCKYQNLMHARCRYEDRSVAWGALIKVNCKTKMRPSFPCRSLNITPVRSGLFRYARECFHVGIAQLPLTV